MNRGLLRSTRRGELVALALLVLLSLAVILVPALASRDPLPSMMCSRAGSCRPSRAMRMVNGMCLAPIGSDVTSLCE